jgi:uncharacterized membrane protein YGL010W
VESDVFYKQLYLPTGLSNGARLRLIEINGVLFTVFEIPSASKRDTGLLTTSPLG